MVRFSILILIYALLDAYNEIASITRVLKKEDTCTKMHREFAA
jgi:hypothetical protein